ncbi:hypothetical protein QBC42DRAFT_318840 [Cladorrhinum samala]|uniref:Uncharacterized protein n=1 Tax=Cladorrhinum samala TaxID=585594 RepID=A0AAV9I7G0_9PEZI|nr:hypothetical protein QBC42DRAFT_318840 [Cladorrhinum samala]
MHLHHLLLITLPSLGSPADWSPTLQCVNTPHPLVVSDTIAAAQQLADWCGRLGPVTENSKISWVRNDSRAYICNYNWWHWDSCRWDEIFGAWVDIQKSCGLGSGGWMFYPEDDGDRIGGKTIGFDYKKNNFCSNL